MTRSSSNGNTFQNVPHLEVRSAPLTGQKMGGQPWEIPLVYFRNVGERGRARRAEGGEGRGMRTAACAAELVLAVSGSRLARGRRVGTAGVPPSSFVFLRMRTGPPTPDFLRKLGIRGRARGAAEG